MEVSATFSMNLNDLASDITDQNDFDEITNFIMIIDELASDYDFTENLIKRLQSALAAEDEASNGS
jgi:hypothetical protein